MTRIPDATKQAILDQTDIVAVIGEHVRLVRSGTQYKGLCPFHSEKSPSFHVTPGKGFFYCFGCGKGGDAAKFLMEIEGLSFVEALKDLGKRVGIQVEEESRDPRAEEADRERRGLFELYDRLSKTFAWFLESQPQGQQARDVLRSRGISEELQRSFRLGYAPRDRRWLQGFLLGKGYSKEFLARSGLFSASHPDFPLFADRLVFPIMDAKGRCISFGGRLLEGEGPKYLNGPETAIFHKQDSLFALDKAREAIRKGGSAIICEGYMDALSFHAAGMAQAVAPLGTAFTERQATLLKRLADLVVFSMDADAAGQNAIARSLPIAARAGLETRVAILPGGKDPSEILEKEGVESLHKLPDFAISGGDFLIRRSRDLFDIERGEGKARAIEALVPFAQALESAVAREAFFEGAARHLRASPASIKADFERIVAGAPRSGSVQASAETARTGPIRRSQDLVFMLAVSINSRLFSRVRSYVDLQNLDDPRARELFIALEECYRAETMGLAQLVEGIKDPELAKAVMEAAASGEFDEKSDRLIEDGIRNARRRGLERRRDRLLEGLESGDASGMQELLSEKMHLDTELAQLKDERDERS